MSTELSADAAWSWFNDPHVICQKSPNGTNWVHVGNIASNGDVAVTSYNVDVGSKTSTVLHAALEVDDHDPASLVVMPDGTLFACYSKHTGSGWWYRRTTNANDPTSWAAEVEMTTVALGLSHVTYPKPILFASGRLMVIFRRNVQAQYLMYTDDNAANWSTPVPFISNTTRRPYINLSYDSVGDRVDVLYTEEHPRDIQTSMWHVTLEGNGDVRKSNGTLIRNVITTATVTYNEGTLVYQGDTAEGRAWGWDICRDPADNTRVIAVFARFPGDAAIPTDHRYIYATLEDSGSVWILSSVVSAGAHIYGTTNEPHYSGGVAVDRVNPDYIYASVRTGVTDAWEMKAYGPQVPNTNYLGIVFDGPLVYYPLEETSGTTADDLMGAHDGTIVNTPTLGGADAGITFDAAQSERITLTTLGSLGSNLLTATFEFWIKKAPGDLVAQCVFGTVQTGTSMIVTCHTNSTGDNVFESGSLAFQMRGNSGANTTGRVQSAGIYDSEWHHVVLQPTSTTTFDIWIDGVLRTVAYTIQQVVVTPINFEFPIMLGARNLRNVADRFFTGSLKRVSFYTTHLSDKKIVQHYGRGAGYEANFDNTRVDLTPGSLLKNVRPVCPRDPAVLTTASPRVVWMAGTYAGYTSYDTAAITNFEVAPDGNASAMTMMGIG